MILVGTLLVILGVWGISNSTEENSTALSCLICFGWVIIGLGMVGWGIFGYDPEIVLMGIQ